MWKSRHVEESEPSPLQPMRPLDPRVPSNPPTSPGSGNVGMPNLGPLMDTHNIGSQLDVSNSDVFGEGGMLMDFEFDTSTHLPCGPESIPDPLHSTITSTAASPVGSSPPSQTSQDPKVTQSQKGGRISNLNREKLDEGFTAIDNVIVGLADATGFSEDRIMSLWEKRSSRKMKGFNPWNVYEGYLTANIEEELTRAGFDAPEGIKWEDTSHEQRRACYGAFQKEYPNEVWEDILRAFELSRKCETAGTTFSKRSSDFHKITSQLMRLTDLWQSKHGFEAIWAMCGNVPNEDAQLSTSYESVNAKEFFSVRCRADADEIRAHIMAHVYDKVSRDVTARAWGDDVDVETEKPQRSTAKPDFQVLVKPDTEVETYYKSRGTTQDMNRLKQGIVDRAKEAGFIIDTNLFPWKGLLDLLAKKGYVLYYWPWDSRGLGDPGTEKGITGLRALEQTSCFRRLDAKTHRLIFVRYNGDPRDLIDSRVPVILGEPNPNTGLGRRLFANGTSDDKGIKGHGDLLSTSTSSKVSSKPSHSNNSRNVHSTTSRRSKPAPKKSRKGRPILPPSSASDEAIEISDSESDPLAKHKTFLVPEVVIPLNKRKRAAPDSSGSEDDRPIVKTYKATRKAPPKSVKMVTFAPQNSGEEEEDDPLADEDPSEVGDASRSPPRMRMRDQRISDHGKDRGSEKRSNNGRAKANGQTRKEQAFQMPGNKKGEEGCEGTLKGTSGRKEREVQRPRDRKGDGGREGMSKGRSEVELGKDAGVAVGSRGFGDGLKGSLDGLDGSSVARGGSTKGGDKLQPTARAKGSYPVPRPAYRGLAGPQQAPPSNVGATQNPSVLPFTETPIQAGTANPHDGQPSVPPIRTASSDQALLEAPVQQFGGGFVQVPQYLEIPPGQTAVGGTAAAPDDASRGSGPQYPYPSTPMYYPQYHPAPPAAGGSEPNTAQAPPYPYTYYPYVPPGTHQGQPYWPGPPQGPPQAFFPQYAPFPPPGALPPTDENNVGGSA